MQTPQPIALYEEPKTQHNHPPQRDPADMRIQLPRSPFVGVLFVGEF